MGESYKVKKIAINNAVTLIRSTGHKGIKGSKGGKPVHAVMSEHMSVHASLLMMRSVKLNLGVNRHDQIVSNLTHSFITQWQIPSCQCRLLNLFC